MSVYLRKDGRWVCHYKNKETGKFNTVYFGTGIDAEKKARECEYQESLYNRECTRRTPKQQSPSFVELLNAYTTAKIGKILPQSMKNILWTMKGVVFPTLGPDIQAINITQARLDQYVN